MPLPDPGWMLVSLRPRGGHGALRRAAARHGGGLVALSPWTLQDLDDPATRTALQQALAADAVVFTSPAAVRAAARLQRLGDIAACAVGSGTAAALRRAGVNDVQRPRRMDSEGLLALPRLAAAGARRIGLVTAPGGRGALQPALEGRGIVVVRADVYARVPVPLASRSIQALEGETRPTVLALTSGEALQRVLGHLPERARDALLRAEVVAASARLAAAARQAGFSAIRVARSPRPADLVAAACERGGDRIPVA
ncbi:uroporphyrinogen-III synthase [Lysobacter sp. A3-1-A15]|uniref:uroporphyrinogen-III synthase n=1 Tax=Novilysobacter viscosus TaxID=3098602 RepID=UPI0039832355